jgi:hypothetical protein
MRERADWDWERTPLAERLPKFCKFAVGWFDDVQVCNVEFSAGGRKQHACACAPQKCPRSLAPTKLIATTRSAIYGFSTNICCVDLPVFTSALTF